MTFTSQPHPLFRREGDDLLVRRSRRGARSGARRAHRGAVARRPGQSAGSTRDAGWPAFPSQRARRADALRRARRLIVEVKLVLPALLDERSKELMREFGRLQRRGRRKTDAELHVMTAKRGGKAYYMISAVAQKYNIHPQTLRLYEREGLLKPSRTEGNTRLYSEEDLEQLETILSLTRDLGVNLAGVEIILNMRRKIEAMQHEVNEFMDYVKHELSRGIGDWEQRLSTALVKSSPTDLVRTAPAHTDDKRTRGRRGAETRKRKRNR